MDDDEDYYELLKQNPRGTQKLPLVSLHHALVCTCALNACLFSSP